MSARDEILAKVKQAISGDRNEAERRAAIEARIHTHPVGVLPYSSDNAQITRELFIEKAQAAAASVTRCKKNEIEAEILKFMRKHNLPLSLRMGDDTRLTSYKIGKDKMLEMRSGPSDGSDEVGVSHAFCAAAETGTLALVSGHENPTTINFLAQNHIVILDEKDMRLHQEDVWQKLRETYGAGNMPRSLNYITGPSRSADIQQILILGAHGPLRLHILLVR